MRILKLILLNLLLLISIAWSFNLYDPYLLFIRDFEITSLVAMYIVVILLAISLNNKKARYLILSVILILVIKTFSTVAYFYYIKSNVLNNSTYSHRLINKHFIIGFTNDIEIEKLALNGIAGIYITKRNIKGKNLVAIKQFLSQLQLKRKQTGLPPLIITTDQEGGPVSHLSPLIENQPALNSLVGRNNSFELAYEYGKKQGKLLRNIGVNVNFGPVADLKVIKPPLALDFHTQINTRAIADTPEEIIRIALPYILGLEKNGVTATLKHFPGLGKVAGDTHHFSAELDLPVSELMYKDWLPFSSLSSTTDSWIMLSHVILKQVDQFNPVSTSNIVVNKLIRKKLGYKGILVTDDLTMAATYNRGFCKSVLGAYNANIDYLLIAYDHEKYYDAVNCLDKNI